MKYLLLDTSSHETLLYAVVNGKLYTTAHPIAGKEQSQKLMPQIADLLGRFQIPVKDLDFIGIGIGPGTFTGTRIGVMVAKTLNFALNIPLIPFCSLMMYCPENLTPFTVIEDAKGDQLFALDAEVVGEQIVYGTPYLMGKKDLITQIPKSRLIVSPMEKPSWAEPMQWVKLPFHPLHISHFCLNGFRTKKALNHKDLNINYLRKLNSSASKD